MGCPGGHFSLSPSQTGSKCLSSQCVSRPSIYPIRQVNARVPARVEQSTSKVSPEQVSGSLGSSPLCCRGAEQVRCWPGSGACLRFVLCEEQQPALGPAPVPPPAAAAAAAATHGAAAVLIGSCLCRKVPLSPIFGSSPSSVPCQASG